jgi:short-subunit dehydrogenase
MTIVITGATGVIDSDLATLLSARGENLLPCGRGDE